MKTFSDLGIEEPLVKILRSKNFIHPTDIQKQTIPLILSGKDLIGQAETGSGKTSACGIPLIQKIDKSINAVQVLVLTPTRELALQYLNEVSAFGTPYGIKPFVIFGGFSKDIHLAKLKDGVQILVATPGRLIDLIYNHYFTLEHVKTLVIDEADEMLNMGFLDDVDFITSCIVQKHQTLLFSATMPDPIKRLAQKYMKGAEHIRLNKQQVVPQNLAHYSIKVSAKDKNKLLKDILSKENIPQAIIFCNTRIRVKEVCRSMQKSIHGTDFLHGGLDQNVRTRIIEKFRQKKIKFLVTTDVMARGIDIRSVTHIINYDLPKNPEIYIHRTGRTARLGKKGSAISLVSSYDREIYDEIIQLADIKFIAFGGKAYEKYLVKSVQRERIQRRK